jgi:hypothetical protein
LLAEGLLHGVAILLAEGILRGEATLHREAVLRGDSRIASRRLIVSSRLPFEKKQPCFSKLT